MKAPTPDRDIIVVILTELVARGHIDRWCQDSTGLVRQYTLYGPALDAQPAPQVSVQVDLIMLATKKHEYLAKVLADGLTELCRSPQ